MFVQLEGCPNRETEKKDYLSGQESLILILAFMVPL